MSYRPSAMLPHHQLAEARYISLETFKRDGQGVKTPVWFAVLEDKLVVFTNGTSYKVKRLRRDNRVRVAECDIRGRFPADIAWYEGVGRIVAEPEYEASIYRALRAKYGWQMAFASIGASLSGRKKDWLVLELDLSTRLA